MNTKQTLTALALAMLASGVSAANPPLVGPHFTVNFTDGDDGAALGLVLLGDGVTGGPVLTASEFSGGPPSAAVSRSFLATLDFTPAAGFLITGYDVEMHVSFEMQPYITTAADNLYPVGTFWHGRGNLSSSFGSVDFLGDSAPGDISPVPLPTSFSTMLSGSVGGAVFGTIFATIIVTGPTDDACVRTTPDGAFCAGIASVFTTGMIDSLTITPLVTAVPEPETWALMLAGLAVGARVLRTRGRDGATVSGRA